MLVSTKLYHRKLKVCGDLKSARSLDNGEGELWFVPKGGMTRFRF